MDKRSILFVILLTVALFFANQWFYDRGGDKAPKTQAVPVATQTPTSPSAPLPPQEPSQFYVLENEYQQIVCSSIGGAISEINLPFASEANKQSIVLPIGFDKTLAKKHPANDRFPSTSYWSLDQGTLQKHAEGKTGGYYPLLRRNVMSDKEHVLYAFSPKHYAFNIVSDDESTHLLQYKVTQFDKNTLSLEASDERRKITKTYTLSDVSKNTPYCLEVEVRVEGDTRGLWLTTGVPEVELISDNFSPTLKYLQQRNNKPQVESLSLPKSMTAYSSITPLWLSNANGFLGLILQPIEGLVEGFKTETLAGAQAPTRLSIIDAEYQLYPIEKYPGYSFLVPLRSNGPVKFRLFAGPYEDDVFKTVDETISQKAENPHFSLALSFEGWFTFISEPFAKFLFILMKVFYKVTHSWGFSIILLTLALRIMLYPLNGWSIKSSIRMQQIAPQVTAIQEKYKKDPKKAQMEVVALYRETGVNPLTGCLPMLIQIPFLIGMFDLLKSAFELRGVSFIPGWIDNLTSPDVVFSWNYPLFFFGTSLHLLPIILGAVMYVQQKLSASYPKDKRLLTDQQKQQKTMGNIMVIVFTVMFYHFPSGLNIYWLSSMGLGILQQWVMNRKWKKAPIVLSNKR